MRRSVVEVAEPLVRYRGYVLVVIYGKGVAIVERVGLLINAQVRFSYCITEVSAHSLKLTSW